MAGVATGSGREIRWEGADIGSARRQDEQREMEKKLFDDVMHGKWEEVAYIYKNESAPTKINPAGDTILHLAILMGNQDGVIKLMKLMEKQVKGIMENILQMKNDWGNTPLHQAAFVGMDNVCSFIAQHYHTQEVLQPRNKQGETPLHVAVLQGHKKAFLALEPVIGTCRRGVDRKDGGNTILHSAIFREHFGE
uniref:Serine/threonine-protein phosphatase 6 regulatory ankyrin repeat subunit B-like n=1 Tax=Elaeis guineensis var. tenera TaxID=51953 RepID=A0A8N4EXH6_ELAGV|nr:serine/threonine-protein phosphatase 6 regulatory ankyrin repeat subunit B-like [Elaeis guineensis]